MTTSHAPQDRLVAPNGVVAIQPVGKRIRATFAGETVVDSTNAVYLLEAGHTTTYYIPLADVRADVLEPTRTTTVCPRKGEARYWDVVVGEHRSGDALWNYPNHYDDALDLSEYVSFYFDRVDEWFEDEQKISAPSEAPGPAL